MRSSVSVFSKISRCVLIALMAAPLVALGPLGTAAHAQSDTPEVSGKVSEEESPQADAFVSDLVSRLRIIASRDDADTAKAEDLRLVLAEDIATRRLQYFLLSKKQRANLTEEQIALYDDLFPRYITSAFAASIDDLVSRTVKVNDVFERRTGDFIVRSKLFSDDGQERASLDWRVLESKSGKQLADVMIDGLSFNVERRAQFTAILKKGGFEALISHMNEVVSDESE